MNPFGGPGVIEAPVLAVTCDTEDLWAAWRDACDDLRQAHLAWFGAGVERRGEAHAVVVAAADRETAAAQVLARRVLQEFQSTEGGELW